MFSTLTDICFILWALSCALNAAVPFMSLVWLRIAKKNRGLLTSFQRGKCSIRLSNPAKEGDTGESDSIEKPGLSVVIPVCGLDVGYSDNIRSLFQTTYPKDRLEFIFSFENNDDPAIRETEKLVKEFSDLNVSFVYTDSESDRPGKNHKVNNCNKAYVASRYDWVLFSDANVRHIDADYMSKMTRYTDPDKVGGVSALIIGVGAEDFWARVECHFLKSFYMKGTVFAHILGRTVLAGKSFVVNKKALNSLGGLAAYANHASEDGAMGPALQSKGYSILLCDTLTTQYIKGRSFDMVWNRFVRWTVLRKCEAPFAFMAEIFLSCVGAMIMGLISFQFTTLSSALIFMASHLLFFYATDLMFMSSIDETTGFESFGFWIVKEVLYYGMWAKAIFTSTLVWRDKTFTVDSRGLMVSST